MSGHDRIAGERKRLSGVQDEVQQDEPMVGHEGGHVRVSPRLAGGVVDGLIERVDIEHTRGKVSVAPPEARPPRTHAPR